jgi:RHS repeat-associated protein
MLLAMRHFPAGAEGQAYWVHLDGRGSIAGITQHQGQSTHNYRYDAYGQVLPAQGNWTDPHNHYTFLGKEWDEHLGLYEFGVRLYDPWAGVWRTREPLPAQVWKPRRLLLHLYQSISIALASDMGWVTPPWGSIHAQSQGGPLFLPAIFVNAVTGEVFLSSEVISKASYPRWSPQGDLVFILGGRFAARLIDGRTGRMYGWGCDAFYGSAPPAFEGPEATLHARLDLRTCRVHGLLHIPRLEGLTFWAKGESPDGWILASGGSSQTGGRILLYHPARGLQEVFPGSGPAFSRDGAWLAYYDPEGYLVVRPVEAPRPQRLVRVFDPATEQGGWLAPPGWSPDGTRLVYGTPQGRMFVVDRRTGQVRELGPGWAPDWRPSGDEGGRPHTLENAGRIP